jgi:soluble lytic murein transglycosylase-like protein
MVEQPNQETANPMVEVAPVVAENRVMLPQVFRGKWEAPPPPEDSSNKATEACKVSSRYPDTIRQWCALITKYSEKNGLDPDLIAALIWQESGGSPTAYSRSGAVGLMQVMSRDGIAASFMCPNGPCFGGRPSMQELYDPEFNVKFGTNMLSGLVARYGSVRDGLFKYGPSGSGYYYADKVLGIFNNHKK